MLAHFWELLSFPLYQVVHILFWCINKAQFNLETQKCLESFYTVPIESIFYYLNLVHHYILKDRPTNFFQWPTIFIKGLICFYNTRPYSLTRYLQKNTAIIDYWTSIYMSFKWVKLQFIWSVYRLYNTYTDSNLLKTVLYNFNKKFVSYKTIKLILTLIRN